MSVESARTIGRYEVRHEIGRGMAGAVYLARDLEHGREVALKLIRLKSPDAEVTDAEKRGIYLQEQLARVEPRVAAVYDHGDEGEWFYIAMEHVDGVDLSAVLADGALPERRAAEIALQLCQILETSHAMTAEVGGRGGVGIIHGDIKPENIRLQGERVRILDFGIAKHLADARGYTRNPFGTPPYTPPERLERGVVDRRSDLWALAVVLYVMLAGRRPYTGDAEEMEAKIRHREPPLPLPEEVAPDLRRIVARGLDPAAERRYGSAAELGGDLDAFLAGRALAVDGTAGPNDANDADIGDDTATRRTYRPLAPPAAGAEEGATRRTDRLEAAAGNDGETRRTGPEPPLPLPVPAAPAPAPAPPRRRRWLLVPLLLLLAAGVASQIWAAREGRAIQDALMGDERSDLDTLATRYRRAASWSLMPLPGGVGEELRQALIEEGERAFRSYHGESPPTREGDWRRAYERLRTAVGLDARDRRARAMMLAARGHLERIEAQQLKDRGQRDEARARVSEAVFSFQKAARFAADWPDPYLGLARIWAYTQPDLRQLERALAELESRGYPSGRRETAMLADGYRFRGLSLADEARRLQGQEREAELLREARRHLLRAMVLYDEIPGFADAAANRAGVERRLTEVEDRLEDLEGVDEEGFFEDLFG